MKNIIYAEHDEEGVYVYQAFKPKTVEFAVKNGTFGKGFGLERLSWIKPSFGWILRRSKYASQHRMTAIAKIKLHHWAWLEILNQSIPTHFDDRIFKNEDDWQRALNASSVIHQWDPERDLVGRRLPRQSIQVGLRGDTLKKYVTDYIIKVEDVTPLAVEIGRLVKARKRNMPDATPVEELYTLEDELNLKLGIGG